MRSLAAALACLLALSSATASAGGFGRKDKKSSSSSDDDDKEEEAKPSRRSSSSGSGFGRSSSSTEEHERPSRRAHRGSHYVSSSRYDSSSYGWRDRYYSNGWGVYPTGYYAHGYHPYWGAPTPPPQYSAPSASVAAIFLGAYAGGQGPEFSGELSVDGRHWGLNARALTLGNPDGAGGRDTMPLFGFHLTYSFVSQPWARLRLEAGLSGIVAPDLRYYGPDVGISGQLALLGPLGLEASARVTPFPATIIDVEAGAALHLGGLVLRGGLRRLSLDDTAVNEDGGTLSYAGPSLSIGAVF